MKPHLDSLDSYYSISHEPKAKAKPKKDYAGIGAVIFTFTVISIVIALSIYTAWQIAYGQPVEFKNYTNNKMNFSIQYPSNWEVGGYEPYFPVVNFRADIDEREVDWHKLGFEIYTHKIQPYLDTDTMTLKNTSLQQRVQEELNDISRSNDTNLIRQNEVTVGGNNGWKVEYRTIDKNNDRYGFVIFTIADGKFYVLRYFEDSLKVPETLPLANKMVESFQVGIK